MIDSPKTTESRPVENVAVAIIGAGDSSKLATGEIAITPGPHLPNVIISVVSPIAAIIVRFINTYLTTLLGVLTGAMATNVIQATDFIHLVFKCAGLSLVPAGIGLIKDCITIFGKLEQKFPLITGSV